MDRDRTSIRQSRNERDRARERGSTKDEFTERDSGKDRHRDRHRDRYRNDSDRRRGSVDRERERDHEHEIRDDEHEARYDGKRHDRHRRSRGRDLPRDRERSSSPDRGYMDREQEEPMEPLETSRKQRESRHEESLEQNQKSHARAHRSRGDDRGKSRQHSFSPPSGYMDRENSLEPRKNSRKQRDCREESPEESQKPHSRREESPEASRKPHSRHRLSRTHYTPHERSSSPDSGSNDQDELIEPRQTSRKRRERRDGSQEESRKRPRVETPPRDEKKEILRFEDSVDDVNGTYHEKKRCEAKGKEEERKRDEVKVKEENGKENKMGRKERKFSDAVEVVGKRDRYMEEDEYLLKDKIKEGVKLENGPAANVVAAAPSNVDSNIPLTSGVSHTPLSDKVSLITTTNENEGVNITRSDEVTGKFSTDGISTSGAGKSGNLSFDALAKAKKALQKQKEISEKLKKIPVLNKLSGASSVSNSLSTTPASAVLSSQTLPDEITLQKASSSGSIGVPSLSASNYEAVKRAQELASKMGFRQDPEFAPLINMFSSGPLSAATVPQKSAKVPVLRLDAHGREVDEYGNVVNMTNPANLSTLKVNINKQKKEAFQIFRPELDINNELNPHFDERMGIDKTKLLRPKKMSFQFVEEGRWSKQAEIMKFKNFYGEAQARELRIKQSQYDKLKGDDINPNMVQVSERVKREEEKIPDIEWWDMPLLTSGRYSDSLEDMDNLNKEKITIFVEHPRPIDPPAEPAAPPPQPLKLTKKEQKKLRTQRRLAKERDRQEMIRQGLIEPPKPKVKMSNLMKVLGCEATQDPTRHEMEIRNAAAEREQAHVDRNIARKLTPAERREKKEKKLFEDILETLVSVYKINNLAHKQLQYKVDVNAQENRLTGCAAIESSFCVVAVEGCKKSIKRYGNLMLRRINWDTPVEDNPEDDTIAPNKCVLVWQGSIAKPSFNRFIVKKCNSQTEARKVFMDAGVPHYWDMSANFSDELL